MDHLTGLQCPGCTAQPVALPWEGSFPFFKPTPFLADISCRLHSHAAFKQCSSLKLQLFLMQLLRLLLCLSAWMWVWVYYWMGHVYTILMRLVQGHVGRTALHGHAYAAFLLFAAVTVAQIKSASASWFKTPLVTGSWGSILSM